MKSLFIFSLGVFALSNCSNSNFSSGTAPRKAADAKKPEIVNTAENKDIVEVFGAENKAKAPVDLVWVIDNSGSMGDNVAKVRKNFDSFLNSVSNNADVKVILISAKTDSGMDTGLDLPATAKNGVQLRHHVGSIDGAEIAALASCEISESSASSLCGESFAARSYTRNSKAAGIARAHFRPGASRAYVFVTDDETRYLSGEVFVRMVTKANAGVAPRVFAFRGQSKSIQNCSIANLGVQYDKMIAITKGEGFDLCLDDWSPHFQKLSQSIANLVQSNFPLKALPVLESVKVQVNGEELAAGQFSVTGQTLNISKPLDANRANEIKVTYQAQ